MKAVKKVFGWLFRNFPFALGGCCGATPSAIISLLETTRQNNTLLHVQGLIITGLLAMDITYKLIRWKNTPVVAEANK